MNTILNNKKAWLRIVEAVIGVLIIASVFTFILVRREKQRTGEEIDELARTLIFQIERNESLREIVISREAGFVTDGKLYNSIGDKIPDYLEFKLKICTIEDEICGLEDIKKRIYVNEVIISSSLNTYNPRRLKLFLWEK